jgi:uncharacterized membrane protein YeaQ/YmgE (transglycosylase-associated protein family)
MVRSTDFAMGASDALPGVNERVLMAGSRMHSDEGRHVRLAEAGVLALAVGFVFGMLGRQVLRSRIRISVAEATLSGIFGAIIGAGVASAVLGRPSEPEPGWAALGAVIGTILVLLAVDRFAWLNRRPTRSARDLVAGGESGIVEFKSTARYNLHSKQRDEKLEQVVVKTIAAFANTEGGTLLIGVGDDGKPLGLDNDLQFMKAPDLDRYELWLRDLLTTSIGVLATADIRIDFEQVDNLHVCVARVPPATSPVVVSAGKGKDRALYVRSGNSTRGLQVDEALAYSARRWRPRTLRTFLG